MYEKVNPAHPDKIADRIAGALVDIAYSKSKRPKIAVEITIGHGRCFIIAETSVKIPLKDVKKTVYRIAGTKKVKIEYIEVPQDEHLSKNQEGVYRCGDNGIFVGMPLSDEEKNLSRIARNIYNKYPTDGKYIIYEDNSLVICQSNAKTEDLKREYPTSTVNPLGDWTGGTCVDTGCVNRKLGSDMARSITGGGIHGKDLSKADVSLNIYAFLKAQETNEPCYLSCAIGDEYIDGHSYTEIVSIAKDYIDSLGGFEKFAEWGLV